MDFLWTLAKAIEADPQLRAGLRYRPNSSLYQVGDRLLYAEARDSQTGRAYHLVAVDHTAYLAKVLTSAASGAGLDELAAVLTGTGLADEEVTGEEAREYLAQLIDSQLLVADCQPHRHRLAGRPARSRPCWHRTRPRRHRRAAAAGGDHLAGRGRGRLRRAARSLPRAGREPVGDLPAAPDPARFVQVDLLVRARAAELSPAVAADLLTATRLLHALAPPRGADALAGFREQFDRRYGTREMPLAQVLDEESGIGFAVTGQRTPATAAPLLAGLPLAARQHQQAAWTPPRRLPATQARGRARGAAPRDRGRARPRPGRCGIRISRRCPTPSRSWPRSRPSLTRRSAAATTRLLVGSVGGPSGARLLGRFCHADDELHDRVRAHLRAEEQARPDCVFAEVVHLPAGPDRQHPQPPGAARATRSRISAGPARPPAASCRCPTCSCPSRTSACCCARAGSAAR